MSNATRKRDSDGLPKQENPIEDETHYIVPRSKGNKFEERFVKCFRKLSREECLSRIKNDDKVALMEISAFIATERANIDPNGSDFLDGVVMEWKFPKESFYMNTLKIILREDAVRKPALDGIFRDFCLSFALEYGEVTGLVVKLIDETYGYEFNIPPAIGRLQNLQELKVNNCKFIPHKELSKLPKLELLNFAYEDGNYWGRTYDYLNDSLFMTRLPRLKKLYTSNAIFPSQKAIFQWILEHVPRLEELSVADGHLGLTVDEISDTFSFTNTTQIHKNLTSISLSFCGMNEAGLEHLLFDVLPNFPMVSKLDVSYNTIESIRSIAQRLSKVDANAGTVNKLVLKSISVDLNPFCRRRTLLKTDSEELAAFCHILRLLPTIEEVHFCDIEEHPKLWYELILNRAGRRILEDTRFNDPPLPLSIWSLVLERLTRRPVAYKIWRALEVPIEAAGATALFYLLHNGPVLLTESKSKKKDGC